MSALDIQIGGGHYKGMKIQPMEYSMANGLDACQHTAIKYISRFRDKGGIQDLEKAKHCIDMLIEFEQKKMSAAEIQSEQLAAGTFEFADEPVTAAKEAFDNLTEVILKYPTCRKAIGEKFGIETDPYGPRDAEGWYTWNGDETMRPAGNVEIMFRDGDTAPGDAESIQWHTNTGYNSSDIVKWRPAQ